MWSNRWMRARNRMIRRRIHLKIRGKRSLRLELTSAKKINLFARRWQVVRGEVALRAGRASLKVLSRKLRKKEELLRLLGEVLMDGRR